VPIRLSDIANRKRTITFSFEVNDHAEDVSITYSPAFYTVEREEELRRRLEDYKARPDSLYGAEDRARRLADILVSWDVVGDDGKPYPTTFVALRSVDSNGFLLAVEKAIQDDLYPNSNGASASNSPAG